MTTIEDETMMIIPVVVMVMIEIVTVAHLGVIMNPVVQVNTIIITNQTEVRSILIVWAKTTVLDLDQDRGHARHNDRDDRNQEPNVQNNLERPSNNNFNNEPPSRNPPR